MIDTPDIRILNIEDLAFGGDGLAHDSETGLPIFVPYGLPGDTLRVRIKDRKEKQMWGQILEVITPSPIRLDHPPCLHCFDCGGCQLQHMRLSDYRAFKVQSVMDRLEKAGLVPENLEPLVHIDPGTRRRATLAAILSKGQVVLGFNRTHSSDIIDLNECHVMSPDITRVLPMVRDLLLSLMKPKKGVDVSICVLDTGLDVMLTGDIEIHLMAQEAMAEFVRTAPIARLSHRLSDRHESDVLLQPQPARLTIGGVVVDPAPGSFLQPSVAGEKALIHAVCQGVGDAASVLDLFAGMGTFSYPLARMGKSVHAIDADGPGIRALVTAARGAGLKIETSARNLYRDPVSIKDFSGVDAIVFDPPRAGAKGQAPVIAASGVPCVVAVSCNPATFVQDAAHLTAAGYRFHRLTIVDQFIWSSHVELVAHFMA